MVGKVSCWKFGKKQKGKKIPVFLLNGPIGSGKSTLQGYLMGEKNSALMGMAGNLSRGTIDFPDCNLEFFGSDIRQKLYDLTIELFDLYEKTGFDREGRSTLIQLYFENRTVKSYPHRHFTVNPERLKNSNVPVLVKAAHSQPVDTIHWEIRLSPREALIFVSELMIKPVLGNDYFARCRDLKDTERFGGMPTRFALVDGSCGFQAEVDYMANHSDLFFPVVVRIDGRGEFSDNDSRGKITAPETDYPGGNFIMIENTGEDVNEFLRVAGLKICDWLIEYYE